MTSREARNRQVQQARQTVQSWPAGLQRSASSSGSGSRSEANSDRATPSPTQNQQQRGPH